jgi:hypothetical protein
MNTEQYEEAIREVLAQRDMFGCTPSDLREQLMKLAITRIDYCQWLCDIGGGDMTREQKIMNVYFTVDRIFKYVRTEELINNDGESA